MTPFILLVTWFAGVQMSSYQARFDPCGTYALVGRRSVCTRHQRQSWR